MPETDVAPKIPAPIPANRILSKMLERLFATLVNGPSLNCRPHSSRQRVDLFSLSRLKDVSPEAALTGLLGEERKMKCAARAPAPPKRLLDHEEVATEEPAKNPLTDEERATITAWREQESLFGKLRVIAEDARTYEQDTGVHVLNIGFPLLSLPPNSLGAKQSGASRRIVAPIAFIPVSIIVKQGATRSIELQCSGEGTDRVIPNVALLAWLEQQTGKRAQELFADEPGEDPWRELRELVAHVAAAVEIPASDIFAMLDPHPPIVGAAKVDGETVVPTPPHTSHPLKLTPAPRTDESDDGPAILPCAILGLFPLANQGLLRDMQAMAAGEALDGPVASFIELPAALEAVPESMQPPAPVELRPRQFGEERLITEADPCQSRAVRLARECQTLVIHGPPGTGKSQTITNIIGDHLARGERVLVVSDKRTALDVVANRLRHLGLGGLVGIVHDPQRDQRDLYKAIRQQLDDLPEAVTHPHAARQLEATDTELQRLHGEVTKYAASLTTRDGHGYSFHDLVGEWFGINPAEGLTIDEAALRSTPLDMLDRHTRDIQDILERGRAVDLPGNPWRNCAGIDLPTFLVTPMSEFRAAMLRGVTDAEAADATADTSIPPFAMDMPLEPQANARILLADDLAALFSTTDPAVLAHWAGRDLESIQKAEAKLKGVAEPIAIFHEGPMDETLASLARSDAGSQPAIASASGLGATCRGTPRPVSFGQAGTGPGVPQPVAPGVSENPEAIDAPMLSSALAVAQEKSVRDYSRAHADHSSRWASVQAAAPNAKVETVTQWLSRDAQSLQQGCQLLDAMKGLADTIHAGPLDRQMVRQYSGQPLQAAQINLWLSALGDYLRTAKKWYAFLMPGAKSAAKPAAVYFGLSLDPSTGVQIRDFLVGLRARLDLRADLDEKILAAPLQSFPPDEDLFRAYEEHATVAHAALAVQHEMPSAPSVASQHIHPLMTPQIEEVTPIFQRWNLEITPADADRLGQFLRRWNARLQLTDLHYTTLAEVTPAGLLEDDALERTLMSHGAFFTFAQKWSAENAIANLREIVAKALGDPNRGTALIDGLRKSPARAQAITKLTTSLAASRLISAKMGLTLDAKLRSGEKLHTDVTALSNHLDDLESILRIGVERDALPPALRDSVGGLLKQSAGVKEGQGLLRKSVLGAEILARLAADPDLQGIDGQRLRSSFDRYRKLDQQKKETVRRVILHRWNSVQKSRLLALTGSRLNSLGADLKRRLTLRGERAMRLRQVIQNGLQTDGGDPLFDLCPVWMASPETVAQLFPRRPLFDTVIFDEASQCRLEEALPVLIRAKRVVIAGDPKQLPPTRFFESAVARSEDEEIETDQQLFESQQGEIEDLLGAALNLEIQECYLDVHYRSRNSDLIQFSNANFYGSRLQAIPGHPKNRTRYSPVTLYRVNGTYEKRRNIAEANQVCQIVRDLLKRADPPSIGIGCFNLPQRDLIVDTLDEMAEQDADFAKRFEAARRREGTGSFEGLFVKNLENVQGDERDHLIISTTYGPDPSGKFHRRFGPVGNVGGGRRLNVLVTRAREEVHLVTSIPASTYHSLPPIPAGQTPSGAYLLFAYLQYAEQLATDYETANRVLEQTPADAQPRVEVRPSKTPSHFARTLAERLAVEHHIGSDVHWGNEGFCVDVALHHPTKAEEVTVGVLCDTTRFNQSADPVEWDIFRTGILESQGWQLHRVWTPHFYRDAEGGVKAIVGDAEELLRKGNS